ncbi:ubiquitin-conjugating enzyme E2E 2 [Cricetulus griseus]
MYRLDVSVAVPLFLSPGPFCDDLPGHFAGSKMSTEAQRVDDSPSTSGGSSDGDQRESVQQEPEREQVQPKKKEGKLSSKTAAKLSTSAKRIQKELAEITLDPPPNCRQPPHGSCSCSSALMKASGSLPFDHFTVACLCFPPYLTFCTLGQSVPPTLSSS